MNSVATWIRLHYPPLHLVYSNTAARKDTRSSSDRRRASLHLKGTSLSPFLCLLPFWTRSESVRLSDGLWVCLQEVPFPCYSGGRAPSPPRRLSSPPCSLPPSCAEVLGPGPSAQEEDAGEVRSRLPRAPRRWLFRASPERAATVPDHADRALLRPPCAAGLAHVSVQRPQRGLQEGFGQQSRGQHRG